MCAIMEDYAKEYARESYRKAEFQLFCKGVDFEVVRLSLTNLSEEELREIYSSVDISNS